MKKYLGIILMLIVIISLSQLIFSQYSIHSAYMSAENACVSHCIASQLEGISNSPVTPIIFLLALFGAIIYNHRSKLVLLNSNLAYVPLFMQKENLIDISKTIFRE